MKPGRADDDLFEMGAWTIEDYGNLDMMDHTGKEMANMNDVAEGLDKTEKRLMR